MKIWMNVEEVHMLPVSFLSFRMSMREMFTSLASTSNEYQERKLHKFYKMSKVNYYDKEQAQNQKLSF